MNDARLDGVAHDLRQNGPRQIGHARPRGTDLLDQVPRIVFVQRAHELMAVSGEDRLQRRPI